MDMWLEMATSMCMRCCHQPGICVFQVAHAEERYPAKRPSKASRKFILQIEDIWTVRRAIHPHLDTLYRTNHQAPTSAIKPMTGAAARFRASYVFILCQ